MHETHKKAFDNRADLTDTMDVGMRNTHDDGQDAWLSPKEVAAIVPGASARSVREWCASKQVPGAIRLPSGRWRIPWSAVVAILGCDPRVSEVDLPVDPPVVPEDDPPGDPLPGLGG